MLNNYNGKLNYKNTDHCENIADKVIYERFVILSMSCTI